MGSSSMSLSMMDAVKPNARDISLSGKRKREKDQSGSLGKEGELVGGTTFADR